MNYSNTYEEVYEILSYMDKRTVMKIPEDILNAIKTQRNFNFKTRIDKNDIFNQKNVSKEAIDLLCWLDYNYWMDDDKKIEIDDIIRRNYQKSEEKKREKYNPEDIFKKNSDEIQINDNKVESNLTNIPAVAEKKSLFARISEKIKKLFHIK